MQPRLVVTDLWLCDGFLVDPMEEVWSSCSVSHIAELPIEVSAHWNAFQ